jgi:1,4-dihydroxy-2-naphthoate octaprenyltransferase
LAEVGEAARGADVLDVGRDGPSAGPTTHGFKERLIAYKDLAKLEIFDVYLTVPLAASLLTADQFGTAESIAILVLMLFTQIGVVTAACALDDVAGIRDGIDTYTYGQDSNLRPLKRKPLVNNRLTEAQAIRYAYIAAGVGVACVAAAYAVADFEPRWAPLMVVAIVTCVLFYSWGPKLSYIGGQEFVVVLGVTFTLAGTYALLTGGMTWTVVLEGLLLGIWLMQLTAFANQHDREGDKRANRVTMAVRLDPSTYNRYLTTLYVLSLVTLAIGLVTEELPWELAPLAIPALVIQWIAFNAGVMRGDGLRARALSLTVLRAGWVALFVANLVA